MEKPDWDSYFMAMTFMVATRSIDTSTKCGCVVVAPDHTILSIGYNNPPSGCDDHEVPMTRPEKYPYMIHSEENSIINAAKKGISLDGATFYITGYPCSRCFRGMKNVGAKRIMYGPNMAVMCTLDNSIGKEDFQVIKFMNRNNPIEFVEYKGDFSYLFDDAKKHYLEKKEENG